MQNNVDAPAVPVKPPIVMLGLIAAGMLLDWLWPLSAGGLGGDAAFIGGALLMLSGIVLAALSVRGLAAAGTTYLPDAPNAALVVTGIYRYSRNPIYIGLILLYAGFAVLIASPWALLLLPLFVAFLRYLAIGREEAYLIRRFGQPYLDYMARVPRWL